MVRLKKLLVGIMSAVFARDGSLLGRGGESAPISGYWLTRVILVTFPRIVSIKKPETILGKPGSTPGTRARLNHSLRDLARPPFEVVKTLSQVRSPSFRGGGWVLSMDQERESVTTLSCQPKKAQWTVVVCVARSDSPPVPQMGGECPLGDAWIEYAWPK